VAGLLLARTAARQREIAVRAALGAGRSRIVRQLLTESVVLGLAGGLLGFVVAAASLSVLKSVLPAYNPLIAAVSIDWQSFAFLAALAVLTGVAFGLAPALSASRLNLAAAFKTRSDQAAGLAGMRLRSGLIVCEVTLTVVLVIGAGLLIKSLWRLTLADPGFNAAHLLTVRVYPQRSSELNRSAVTAFYQDLLLRAGGIAGVTDVAAANTAPLASDFPAVPVEFEGHQLTAGQDLAPMLWAGAVTSDYFKALQIPLVEGRLFSSADGEKSPAVVIVSRATANRYWPSESAIGKQVRIVWEERWRTVVGVVGDVRQHDISGKTPEWIRGAFYMPYPQSTAIDRQMPVAMNLFLRTTADPARVSAELGGLVTSVNPSVPVTEGRTLDSIINTSTSESRSLVWLFICFGGAALILAAVGTYGVISYAATQRTYEMGVRVALGATRGGIFWIVLSQSLRLVSGGLALGVLTSLALSRLVANFLYGVTSNDPAVFLGVGVLLILVALVAGYFPARRASTVDPMTALRQE
ncbi:MAG TPA: FtsX-like permease family protein, partial [Blastocatellia bacterium]|nr:FtsX-like permease family protein [Blastocatellia bacterium]